MQIFYDRKQFDLSVNSRGEAVSVFQGCSPTQIPLEGQSAPALQDMKKGDAKRMLSQPRVLLQLCLPQYASTSLTDCNLASTSFIPLVFPLAKPSTMSQLPFWSNHPLHHFIPNLSPLASMKCVPLFSCCSDFLLVSSAEPPFSGCSFNTDFPPAPLFLYT